MATHSTAERNSGCVLRCLDLDFDLLTLRAAQPVRYPHLLESVAHGTPQARYDILFAFPGEVLEFSAAASDGFLDAFDRWYAEERIDRAPDVPPVPFRGGWLVFLSYELAAEVERTLRLPASADPLPTGYAVRCPATVIRDRARKCTYLAAESEQAELLDALEADVRVGAAEPFHAPSAALSMAAVEEEAPEAYREGVRQVKQYIFDGDVFQVNLSRAWRVAANEAVDAVNLYAQLRAQNPAPFAALVTLGDAAIISSSPERLVHVCGDEVQARPIAGTRPRAKGAVRDRSYSRELLAHPKERAEHVMLIDLERNDLGRVCQAGSVEVNELMALESYAHVHHIVSNVRGRLGVDISPAQVMRAVFPGGTITGCPKVRCMEIIAELERTGRGAYTGSVGYVNRDGDLDLNILIRTLVQKGAEIRFRAGGGIVADSDPQRELEETQAKARGMLNALGVPEAVS